MKNTIVATIEKHIQIHGSFSFVGVEEFSKSGPAQNVCSATSISSVASTTN
jgi:hypothetical protein